MNSLHNIAYNAKLTTGDFIETCKVNFDFANRTVSLGSSLHTELGKTSLKVNGNEIEAEYTPNDNVQCFTFQGWEIEGQIGYQVKGSFEVTNHLSSQPAPSPESSHKILETLEVAALATGIVALIIFSDGMAIPLIATASVSEGISR